MMVVSLLLHYHHYYYYHEVTIIFHDTVVVITIIMNYFYLLSCINGSFPVCKLLCYQRFSMVNLLIRWSPQRGRNGPPHSAVTEARCCRSWSLAVMKGWKYSCESLNKHVSIHLYIYILSTDIDIQYMYIYISIYIYPIISICNDCDIISTSSAAQGGGGSFRIGNL